MDEDDEDLEDDMLRDVGIWLSPGTHLAVMPIARVTLDFPVKLIDHKTMFYPPGFVSLETLNVIPNDPKSKSIAEFASAASRVDAQALQEHSIVAFPVPFEWDALWRTSHQNHMEFIRYLSELVDHRCLNLIRYQQCRIEPVDALPGKAGQLDSNHMMSGALLYSAGRMEARIIGGAAFSHFITKGLGLPLESIDGGPLQEGDVGHIAMQGLALYTALLEASSATEKFIQALSLLEFLADPDKFRSFKEVKKVVARYVARDRFEYDRILARFEELTHKADPTSGAELGYRTRIVHIGDRLEALVPDSEDRRKLFEEMDSYIRPMINHMIAHSAFGFEEYLKVRDQMKPFEVGV